MVVVQSGSLGTQLRVGLRHNFETLEYQGRLCQIEGGVWVAFEIR